MIIKSIQLISNNIAYGLTPAPTDEVEQHLTVSSSGWVWFSARNYKQLQQGKGFCRKKQIRIGPWKSQFLLELINKIDSDVVTIDCGEYDLCVRYEDGSIRHTFGPLIEDIMVPSYGNIETPISKIIRRYIPIYDLWGFEDDPESDYEGKKTIFEFLKSWTKRFSSHELTKIEFEENFGDICASLGFQMDCSHEFDRLYPGSSQIPSTELDAMINSIQDVDLLGSAVYSQWRYLTHWADFYELDKDTCHWFKIILRQMKELTKKKKHKITIISE